MTDMSIEPRQWFALQLTPAQELEQAGRALFEARQQRARALAAVRTALIASQGVLPLSEAAALAGVSRPTAYRLIGGTRR